MMKAFLFLFLFLMLNLQLSFADEFTDIIEEVIPSTQLTKQELRHLKSQLKIQKIIIKGSSRIHFNGNEFTDIQKATNTIDDIIKEVIEHKSHTFTNETGELLDDLSRTGLMAEIHKSISKSKITKGLVSIKNTVANMLVSGKSALRQYGIRAGLTYMVGSAINWGLPVILMANGQFILANTIIIAPIPSLMTGGYIFIEKAVKKKQLNRLMGGSDIVHKYNQMSKQIKKHFKISKVHELIDITTFEGKTFAISVERQNIFSKIKSKLGFASDLNYKTLSDFLEEKKISNNMIETIKKSSLPDSIKTMKIINYINKYGGKQELQAFMDTFSKFIKEVDYLPRYSDARSWAIKASMSQSLEELYGQMKRIPKELPPSIVKTLWFDFILPESSKNIDFKFYKNYLNFRRLYEDNEIKAIFHQSELLSMSDDMQDNFDKYFMRAVPNVRKCDLQLTKLAN
jgi:hypothetical protein